MKPYANDSIEMEAPEVQLPAELVLASERGIVCMTSSILFQVSEVADPDGTVRKARDDLQLPSHRLYIWLRSVETYTCRCAARASRSRAAVRPYRGVTRQTVAPMKARNALISNL